MKINLNKLHEGLNELGFQIKPEDLGFDEQEETLFLFPNEIRADVEVQKFSDKYFVKVALITKAHYACDRCLDEFDRSLAAGFQLVYSKHSSDDSTDDAYRSLGEDETEIDLSADVKENILLVVPMKRICRESCQGLCPHCGVNLNEESCDCQQETIDPRWEILKTLQKN